MNGWRFGFVAALALMAAAPATRAAECGQEVMATIDLMQDGRKAKLEGTRSEVKEGAQSSEIKESWQGGTPTQGRAEGGSASGDTEGAKVAFNEEAASFLEKAARLAKDGQSGGCRQVLVQAQRILGVVPADTPLPRTQ